MIDGKLSEGWLDAGTEGGELKHQGIPFRSWVTPDSSPGSSGKGDFKAPPVRYHLYFS